MNAFRRLSAIDQAESAIEQGIADGKWGALLPSYQTLGKILRLSTPTIARAVGRLVERGLLVSPGKRQRFRIAAKAGGSARRRETKPPGPRTRRHLLVLCPNRPEEWDIGQRQVVFETMRSAADDGWECSQETMDYIRSKEVLKRWDNLILRHQPTHILAIQGTRALAKWARAEGIKVAFIGGHNLEASEGASLGVRLGDQLRHCVGVLQSKGHRRILMPYWGDMAGFAAYAARIIGEVTGVDPARLADEGWVFGTPHTTPAEHRARLLRAMRELSPTAIITVDWRDYLVASQCAGQLGLGIPGELSLAVLNPGPDTEWAMPVPSHYKVRQDFFIEGVRDWRQGKPVSADSMTQAIIASWTEGETLGPPTARLT